MTTLKGVLRQIKEHREKESANPNTPAQARMFFEHSRPHLEAESAWTGSLSKKVDKSVVAI